jgi:hypothetical protein
MDVETVIAVSAISVPIVVSLVTFGIHLNNRLVALEAKLDTLGKFMENRIGTT